MISLTINPPSSIAVTPTNVGTVSLSVGTGGITLLSQLSDVNLTGLTDNQILEYDSATGKWKNVNSGGPSAFIDLSDVPASYTGQGGKYLKVTEVEGGIEFEAIEAADLPTGIDAAKIGDGSVSNTEFQTLNGAEQPFTNALKTKLDGIENGADVTDAGNVGAAINGSTEQTVINNTDRFALFDGVLKWGSWTTIKSTLKTYFDTLYAAIVHTHVISDITGLQTALDGKVDENAAITGATKTKITYDAKGLVTAGADATTADIADSSNKRYVTDAQLTVIGNTSGTNTGDNATNSQYSGLAASKQDTLVSGTNIKTINSTSLLGSGDITISTTDATKLPLAGGTMIGAINTQNLLPATTATYTLGDATHYYSNAYTTRQYLNSTAYLDGGTPGAVGITGNVGIGTTTPAHYLDVSKTLNSRTAYGINSTMTASTLQSDVASTGNDETFTNSHYAWSFVASAAHTVGSISVRLKKVGTVTNTTDTIQLKIFSDNAGTPGTLLLTTDNIKMGTLTTSYVEYLFGGDMTLVNGTTYWIAVRKSAAVTGGGSIAIDRNGTALTTCNTATPVSGDWTVNAGQGRYAVYGRSPIGIRGSSTNYIGVQGNSTNSYGVYGTSTNSIGVQGTSTNYIGVQGTSTNYIGVHGSSTNSQGVYGISTNSQGVNGTSTNSIGVQGTSTNSQGVNGSSTNYIGVQGSSTNSYGASLTQSGTLTAANSSNAVLVRRYGVTNSTGSLNYSGNVLQITDNPTGTGTVSGALISGSLSVAADGSGTTERIRFDPRVANGASAVAHMLDTGNALSTAGALLLDVRNNGVSKHAVDLNGNIIEKVPTTPASATAAGVQGTICWDADYVYVCVATNTWKRSALGSW